MENKSCKQCNTEFAITDTDLAFYKKISPTFDEKTFEIPVPTLCPQCRRQRRIAWRNVGKIYNRKSDLSGKPIVSCFAPNSKFKVWHLNEWLSDELDPYKFGRDFDFSRPFFDQLFELEKNVPLPHMNSARNENSEYINNSSDCKNCYLIENSTEAEDSLYSLGLFYSKDCVDCFKAYECENCYECVNIEKCYGCYYCKDTFNSSESLLLEDCSGCKNCYGCSNLSNKQYWIFNEQRTKEEFKKVKNDFFAATPSERWQLIKKAHKHSVKFPKKFAHASSNENSNGDYVFHSKNSDGFFLDNCEDVRNSTNLSHCKDFYDVDYWGDHSEVCYESAEIGTKTHNVLFSRKCHGNIKNIYYSLDCCFGSHDLFSCCGIKHGEYSILNKKYTKEEYEKLVAKIIEYMQKTGEWGEFFPFKMSQFAYNETSAMDYFPLGKEEVIKLGSYWQDENSDQKFNGSPYEPLDISEYSKSDKTQELLGAVLVCKESGRPYKIQPQELAYYLKHHLQIPLFHPDIRYQNRFKQVNPLKTWHRRCDCTEQNHGHSGRCQVEFETTYSPDRPERVYCESCYQKVII
ncbi:MAG: hypothetical protein ABH810_01145 [bacterium]